MIFFQKCVCRLVLRMDICEPTKNSDMAKTHPYVFPFHWSVG